MDDLDQVRELLLEEAFQQYSPIKRAQRLRFRIFLDFLQSEIHPDVIRLFGGF